MNFIELAKKRKSIRKYLNTTVEKEKIMQCIEAARLAPSACNSQPWKFIIVDKPELCKDLAKKTFGKIVPINHFTLNVPVFIVLVTEKVKLSSLLGGLIKKRQFSLMDIGITAEHFCLQATELGLGTCMLGWFNEKAVKKLLKIPRYKSIGLIITLGYPDPKEDYPRNRKKLEDIYSENKY